ncbi:MAG: diphosphatase [Clostridiales bacterium]|jgi:NAD+ diphosphatase|nr:diphosphatase [Clostridiales bacterium]MDK2934299.1 diphosphatase [Clostridiales bacterium]
MITESLYKRYIPGVVPPDNQVEPAWWFIFHGSDILVKVADDSVSIPCVTHLEELNLSPIRKQYLGVLDGRHCYSVEIIEDVNVKDMCYRELRSLFGLIEDDLFLLAGRATQIVDWDRNHQYCGRCGAKMKTKQDERAKVCPKCGLLNYPRISPAIIVAIVKDAKILLAHANRFPHKFYSVIAGFVEPGETFEECVRREVKEEVNLEVKNIRYFASQPWPFPDSLMVAFTAEYAGGEIVVDEVELSDAGWFGADDLPPIPGKISIARRLIDWFVENYG